VSAAPTIYEVASTAQVSVRTVSRYLNDPQCVSTKTADAIVAAMQELRFRPSRAARALKGASTGLVGVLSDCITTSPDSFELIKGLQTAAHRAGRRLLIAETAGVASEIPGAIDELAEHRIDALIVASHSHRSMPAAALERAAGLRTVLLNCYTRGMEVAGTVVPDDEQGARDGLARLYELGHQSVAVFELFPDMRATQLRHAGYLRAARAHGRAEPAFVQGARPAEGSDEFWFVDDEVARLLARTKPTAIIAGNDKMAARIIQSLHKRRVRVPEDVSVLGFDDHAMLVYATDPPLTSVRLPYMRMGERAAEIACGEDDVGTERIRCDVVMRESVIARTPS
jgi:LacI family transcriptional regulator